MENFVNVADNERIPKMTLIVKNASESMEAGVYILSDGENEIKGIFAEEVSHWIQKIQLKETYDFLNTKKMEQEQSIVIDRRSYFMKSHEKITLPGTSSGSSVDVAFVYLDVLKNKRKNQIITQPLSCKVVEVNPAQKTKNGHKFIEITLKDAYENLTKLTMWNSNTKYVDCFGINDVIVLRNAVCSDFPDIEDTPKHIVFDSRKGSVVMKIKSSHELEKYVNISHENTKRETVGRVVDIIEVLGYYACPLCRRRIRKEQEECGRIQCLYKVKEETLVKQYKCTIILKDPSGDFTQITAFRSNLQDFEEFENGENLIINDDERNPEEFEEKLKKILRKLLENDAFFIYKKTSSEDEYKLIEIQLLQ